MQIKEYIRQPHVLELVQMIRRDPQTLTEISNKYSKSATTAHTALQRLVSEGIIKKVENGPHRPAYAITETTASFLNNEQHLNRSPRGIEEFVREPSVLSIIRAVVDRPLRLYEVEKRSSRSHSNVHNTMQKLDANGYVRKMETDQLNRPEYVATDKAVLLLKNLAGEVKPQVEAGKQSADVARAKEPDLMVEVPDDPDPLITQDKNKTDTIYKILFVEDLLCEVRESLEKNIEFDMPSYLSVIEHQFSKMRTSAEHLAA